HPATREVHPDAARAGVGGPQHRGLRGLRRGDRLAEAADRVGAARRASRRGGRGRVASLAHATDGGTAMSERATSSSGLDPSAWHELLQRGKARGRVTQEEGLEVLDLDIDTLDTDLEWPRAR